jgi:hypothetical protein
VDRNESPGSVVTERLSSEEGQRAPTSPLKECIKNASIFIPLTLAWPPLGVVGSAAFACHAGFRARATVKALPDSTPLVTNDADAPTLDSEHQVGDSEGLHEVADPLAHGHWDVFEVDKVNTVVHLIVSYIPSFLILMGLSSVRDDLPLNKQDEAYGNDNQRNVIVTHAMLAMMGLASAFALMIKDAMRDHWVNYLLEKAGNTFGFNPNPGPSAGIKDQLTYQLSKRGYVECVRFGLFVAFSLLVGYLKKDTWSTFWRMLNERRPGLRKPMTDSEFNQMVEKGVKFLLLAESFAAPRAWLEAMGNLSEVFTWPKYIVGANWNDDHKVLVGPATWPDMNNWIGILCMYFTIYNLCLVNTLNQIKRMAESHGQQSNPTRPPAMEEQLV